MMLGTADILDASILIVDDQDANVMLLERLLDDAGYVNVESTTLPREVEAMHRENRYDLILLDLQMPGMDGFEVMERLGSDLGDSYLPVIVLTAQPAHKLRALKAGAKDFIGKPFDLLEVKTRIHNMLEVRLLYKRLETYNELLERTVQERTAELRESELRFRRLTELASDWYWEQNETGDFTQVSGPALEMVGIGMPAFLGDAAGQASLGVERGGAIGAASQDLQPRAVSGLRIQPRQRGRFGAAVSRQRRTDVQRVVPIHRLPGNRRGGDRTHECGGSSAGPPQAGPHSPG